MKFRRSSTQAPRGQWPADYAPAPPPPAVVPVISANQVLSVAEGAANGAVVGTILAANAPTSFQFGNSGGATSSGPFSISPTGVVTKTGALNRALTPTYVILVTAANAGGTSAPQTVTINVTA